MHNFGYSEEGRQGRVSDLSLWQRILAYTGAYWPGILAAVLLSLLVTAATLALPALMREAVDSAISAPGAMDIRLHLLTRLSLLYLFCLTVILLSSFFQVLLLEWTGQSVMFTLRQQLFAHLLALDQAFFHRQPAGSLVTRLTNDIQNMHEMFTSVIVTLFNDLLKMAGVLVMLFLMNPGLALKVSVFLPLCFLITWAFSRLARDAFRAIRSQLARINGELQEVIGGISVIQAYGRQKDFTHTFNALSHEFLRRCLRQINLFAAFMPLTELLGSLAIALILYQGGLLVVGGGLSIGELIAFLAYMRLFFQPMRELSQKYSIVQSAMASAERIFHLLDVSAKIKSPNIPLKENQKIISASHLIERIISDVFESRVLNS